MANFRFRLQSVYDLRKHVEKEHVDRLSRERHTLRLLERQAEQLKAELAHWAQKYLRSAKEGMRPAEAVRINRYIEELNRRLAENDQETRKQRAAVEKARLLLIEKMKDRKTFDTLYDKQRKTFLQEQSRKTEKEIEELIAAGLGRT